MSIHVPTSVIDGLETVRDRILVAITRLRDDDVAGAAEELEAATDALREVSAGLTP